MKGLLVIVPCGQGKIWDKEPTRGATPACLAYTGAPFKVNRDYAESLGDRWVILSAKYGFIRPDFRIPGPYNVTFKDQSTNPIAAIALTSQIADLGLDRFETVVGLGGKEYRAMIEKSFAGLPVKLDFPFAGLRIGEAMHAIKEAVRHHKT